MIKLLPYQENFILSLLLLLLYSSPPLTLISFHVFLVFFSLLLVIFATLINFMFLHDDDYIVIAYLLMMLQTISVIRKRWLKQHTRRGRKKKLCDEKFNRICCARRHFAFCVFSSLHNTYDKQ